MALVRPHKPLSNEQNDTYTCRILGAVVKGSYYNEIHMIAGKYDGVCTVGDMGSGISLKDASGCWDQRGQSQMENSVSSSHNIKTGKISSEMTEVNLRCCSIYVNSGQVCTISFQME